jgi:hemoglobin
MTRGGYPHMSRITATSWGTRLALANSQPAATPPPKAPVPRWGWGEAPPYTGI